LNKATPIKGVHYRDGIDGVTKTITEFIDVSPEKIRDKLESISIEASKLKIGAVSGLQRALDDLNLKINAKAGGSSIGGSGNITGGGGGGGTQDLQSVTDEGSITTHQIKVAGLGIGSVTLPLRGKLDILGDDVTIADVTGSNSSLSFDYSVLYYNYVADGQARQYDVYAYKDVAGTRIYSQTPFVISGTDDGSEIGMVFESGSWDAVPDALGYRIIVTDPTAGAYSNFYFDTVYTNFHFGDNNVGYDDISGQNITLGNDVVTKSANTGEDYYTDSNGHLVSTNNATFNRLISSDGTVSSPSFSFTSDDSMGMYREGVNSLAFSFGGYKRMFMDATALSLHNNLIFRTSGVGSVTAPAYSVVTDTNTGLYFPSADTVAMTVGGVEKWRTTSTGLAVTGVVSTSLGTASLPSKTFAGDLDTGFWSAGANLIDIALGGVNNFEMDNYFGEPRISSKTATAINLWANGNNAFRAIDGWTATWADSVATSYFQVGRASGNTMFSAYTGTPYNRLSFTCSTGAGKGIVFDTLTSGFVVPDKYFDIRMAGVSKFSIAYTTGNVLVSNDLLVNGSSTLGDASTDLITCTGRLLVRTTATDPQDATPANRPAGTLKELVYYAGKLYFCTNSATPTWEKVTSV
jgi:hypothetical protein